MSRKSGHRFSDKDMRKQKKKARAHPDSIQSGCALASLRDRHFVHLHGERDRAVVAEQHQHFGNSGATEHGFDLEGEFHGKGDPAAQADQAMKNLNILVEEAGGTLAHVCKVTTYLLDRAHREPVYNAVARHLRGIAPCGTGLIVSGLAMADMLVEFDVDVVIPTA